MNRPTPIRISPVATKSGHETSTIIDTTLVRTKASDARQSTRKRDIHIFHTGDEDNLHRMLNAVQPGSCITPHRHKSPPKSEALVLLQGLLGYVEFDDHGRPDETASVLLDLDKGIIGVDIRPGVWHTIFALSADTVVFEVKPGPYDASCDKGFAPWAPHESDPQAATVYLMDLEDRFRSIWKLEPRAWGRD